MAEQQNTKKVKEEAWAEIISLYQTTLKSFKDLMDKYSELRFFSSKDGWDSTPEPIFGYSTSPFNAERLLEWTVDQYDEDNPSSSMPPFMYTTKEIAELESDKEKRMIESWKESAEYHRKRAKFYEEQVKNSENRK